MVLRMEPRKITDRGGWLCMPLMEDDGFLEALKGTAAEDWKNEETDI